MSVDRTALPKHHLRNVLLQHAHLGQTVGPEGERPLAELVVVDQRVVKSKLSTPIAWARSISLNTVHCNGPRVYKRVVGSLATSRKMFEFIGDSRAHAHVDASCFDLRAEVFPPADLFVREGRQFFRPCNPRLSIGSLPYPIAHLPSAHNEIHRVKYAIKMLTWKAPFHRVQVERELREPLCGKCKTELAIDGRQLLSGVSHA